MSRILIKNGKVWDGERFYYADVLTDHGKVAEIAENIEADADFIFDLSQRGCSPFCAADDSRQ